MIRRDLPAVLDIEEQCLQYCWTEDDFIRALRQRNVIGKVAEHGEEILGFMIYELHKTRLNILKISTHVDHLRMGIGKALVENLKLKLSWQNRRKLTLEVRESNLAVQLFLRSLGFRVIRILKDHYGGEDTYHMEFRVRTSENAT